MPYFSSASFRMHLSWLGSTAIKIQTKPDLEDVVVALDPYRPAVGSFPRSLAPTIAVLTRGKDGIITLSGNPLILDAPGEMELKGVLLTSTYGHKENHVMLRLDSEQITVGHLGRTNKPLTELQEELMDGVDILLIPVGGGEGYDAESAVKIVNTVEPRVVIPIDYRSDNDPNADEVRDFLKEIGQNGVVPEKKIVIKKKDLPQEEMRVIVLAKE